MSNQHPCAYSPAKCCIPQKKSSAVVTIPPKIDVIALLIVKPKRAARSPLGFPLYVQKRIGTVLDNLNIMVIFPNSTFPGSLTVKCITQKTSNPGKGRLAPYRQVNRFLRKAPCNRAIPVPGAHLVCGHIRDIVLDQAAQLDTVL